MKIAIATNDRQTIAKRTGRAKEFAVFTLKPEGEIIDVEYRENEHAKHHHDESEHHAGQGHQGHGHGRHRHHELHGAHRHDEVIDILKDVDVLLYKAVGKYMRKDLEEGKIKIARATGKI